MQPMSKYINFTFTAFTFENIYAYTHTIGIQAVFLYNSFVKFWHIVVKHYGDSMVLYQHCGATDSQKIV